MVTEAGGGGNGERMVKGTKISNRRNVVLCVCVRGLLQNMMDIVNNRVCTFHNCEE